MKHKWDNISDLNNLTIDYDESTDEFRFSWFEDWHYQNERIVNSLELINLLFNPEEDEWDIK